MNGLNPLPSPSHRRQQVLRLIDKQYWKWRGEERRDLTWALKRLHGESLKGDWLALTVVRVAASLGMRP